MPHTANIKHSKLGILAFVIFLSPLVPLIDIFILKAGIIMSKIFSYEQVLVISRFLTCWSVIAPIAGFIMSCIDLKKPDRLRILPRIVLILSGIGFTTMIISTIYDIIRMG